jgi:hypothetical protein
MIAQNTRPMYLSPELPRNGTLLLNGCHPKVGIHPACTGKEFLQWLLGECPVGMTAATATTASKSCVTMWQWRVRGAAFPTMSLIARSSMDHGQRIDCAAAIGPAASPEKN